MSQWIRFLLVGFLLTSPTSALTANSKDLIAALKEKLGTDFILEEKQTLGETYIVVNPVKPIPYKSYTPSLLLGADPVSAHEFDLWIFLAPGSSVADTYQIKARYYRAEAEFSRWRERLKSIATMNVKPSASDARTLLESVAPKTAADEALVQEYKKFIPEYDEAGGAYRTAPTHTFKGELYRVSDDNLHFVEIDAADRSRALLLMHQISEVLRPLD